MIVFIISGLFTALGVSWYLLPRQFYPLDDLISSIRDVEPLPEDPSLASIDELDAWIEQQIETHQLPGAAVAIVANGKVAWSQGYGLMDIATATPTTTETSFHLASISKPIMGVALMHAIETDIISLDTEVNDLVPFSVTHPAAPETPITLAHLVTHTSGIQDRAAYYRGYGIGEPNMALGDFLRAYLTTNGNQYSPRHFSQAAPGTEYQYSNVGAALAGYALQEATGMPLNDYVRQVVFEPVGMTHSGYFLTEFDNPDDIATAYIRRNVPYGFVSYPSWPDGMIRASVDDLARFLAMVLNDGSLDDTIVISSQSVESMLAAPIETAPREGVFWEIKRGRDQATIGHNGGDPGATTFMYANTETGIGAVVLLNSSTHSAEVVGLTITRQILTGDTLHSVLLADNE